MIIYIHHLVCNIDIISANVGFVYDDHICYLLCFIWPFVTKYLPRSNWSLPGYLKTNSWLFLNPYLKCMCQFISTKWCHIFCSDFMFMSISKCSVYERYLKLISSCRYLSNMVVYCDPNITDLNDPFHYIHFQHTAGKTYLLIFFLTCICHTPNNPY